MRVLFLCLGLAGCASGAAERSNPATDPANLQAEEAPYRTPPASSRDPLLAVEPPPAAEPLVGPQDGPGAAPHEGSPVPATPTTVHRHAGAPGAKSTVYTCPMHPEVRLTKPGRCPKCGMTLVPATPEGGAP